MEVIGARATSMVVKLSKWKTVRHRLGRFLARLFKLGLCLLALLGIYIAITSYRYGVSLPTATAGVLNELSLTGIRAAVSIYDPCEPRHASTGPDLDQLPDRAEYGRIEQVLSPGSSWVSPSGIRVTVEETHNEVISRSPFRFCYQPYDEPRLHELRRKYRLDDIVSPAKNEFEAMVLLRNWTRGRFRRSDFQPAMDNFDALEILDRNWRDHGIPYVPFRDLDPCQLFPMMYCQILISMGHQARLVSADHGMVEVWSNLHRKWVLMDAELNHHFEKDGVPLNLVELYEQNIAPSPTEVRLVRGEQSSGDEDTLMAHLKIKNPTGKGLLPMFVRPLDLVDFRNDWMTNHYFRGHPARSEANSLTFLHPQFKGPTDFRSRLRSVTSNKDDFYWTLNQTEILARPRPNDAIELAFNTVTPNFEYFEVVIDGNVRTRLDGSAFRWRLHGGANRLVVRAVNRFGVRGIESAVLMSVTEPRK